MLRRRCAFFIVCFFLGFTISAQVVINEYSTSNLTSYYDHFWKTEDWVELYNTSAQEKDLSGWHLSDKANQPTKWTIPNGTIIPANGYLLFYCSGRDTIVGTERHTNFKLSQTKGNEVIMLSQADGMVKDSIPLDLTLVGHSRCRKMDGSSDWRIGLNPSLGYSNNGTSQSIAYTKTPIINLAAGFYSESQMLTVENLEENSVLRYTLDGTNPTANSPICNGPIFIHETQVVKVRAFSNDSNRCPGKMGFSTYFINDEFTLPVISIAANDVIELANGDATLIPVGSLEYFNKEKERTATSFGTLNKHGQDSWQLDHRSIDWVSRDEMGYSKAIHEELFSYSERDEYQRVIFRASGDDNYPAVDDDEHEGSTHVRDEYVHTLAQEGGMKLDVRAVERVIVFLNGEYWGVYGMRERPVDHDYVKEYYDQGKYDIQYLSTWGTTEAEYGGEQAFEDWLTLRDFILDNDMSSSSHYQVVKDNLQVLGLIDYMIANLNSVASDWLNYNTGWWRGLDPAGDHKKWGYILWDNDATFDYYINYSGIPNVDPDAQPCDIEEIAEYIDVFFGGGNEGGTTTPPANCETIANGSSPYGADDSIFVQVIHIDGFCCDNDWDDLCQNLYDDIVANGESGVDANIDVGKHEKIFLKLQEENDEFRQLYYSRQADLMNTIYSCDNMLETLDRMVGEITPEMPRQIDRWGGSMEEWLENVATLRSFVEQRCGLLDDGMMDCYDLTGPYPLTLLVQPEGIGEIDLNTLDIENFPWTGDYFGEMENLIKARAFDESHQFSHWISTSGNTIFPDVNTRKASITLTEADTLIAVFEQSTSINDLASAAEFHLFPNPAKDFLNLEYELDFAMDLKIDLYSIIGKQVISFSNAGGQKSAGRYSERLSFDEKNIVPGLYLLKIQTERGEKVFKVNIL